MPPKSVFKCREKSTLQVTKRLPEEIISQGLEYARRAGDLRLPTTTLEWVKGDPAADTRSIEYDGGTGLRVLARVPSTTPNPNPDPDPNPNPNPNPVVDISGETDILTRAAIPTLGATSDHVGIVVGWSATTTPSQFGYNVYTRRSDAPSWMYQRRNGFPITGTTYRDNSVWQGDTLWITVYAIDSNGNDGATIWSGTVVQADRAVLGPISRWSANLFKPVWEKVGSVSLVAYQQGYTTITFGSTGQSISQVCPTYSQTGRTGEYTLAGKVRGEAGKTVMFNMTDTTANVSQDFTLTLTGDWQTLETMAAPFSRTAASTGITMRFGIVSGGAAPATKLDVQYFALLPKANTPYQKTKSRVWEEPFVYKGNANLTLTGRFFYSKDHTQPAVRILTPAIVTLESCHLFGYGSPDPFRGIINSGGGGGRIRVNNSRLWSGNPMVLGATAGKAVSMESWKELRFTNNEVYGTSGIQIASYVGDHSVNDSVTVERNFFWNLDGRISDPSQPGGYKRGNEWTGPIAQRDFVIANVVQMDKVYGLRGATIQDNYMVSFPNESRFEDAISFYKSQGFDIDNRIRVRRNLFRGGYVYDSYITPTSNAYGNNAPVYGGKGGGFPFSGGLGLLGDGGGKDFEPYTEDPCFLEMTENTMLDSSNYIIGIAAGHDSLIDGNYAYRSGLVHSMRQFRIAWGHWAIQVQDYYTGNGNPIDDGTKTGTNRVRWYGNVVTNNRGGYRSVSASGAVTYTPSLVLRNSPVTVANNINDTPFEPEYVDLKEKEHWDRWAISGVVIGSSMA